MTKPHILKRLAIGIALCFSIGAEAGPKQDVVSALHYSESGQTTILRVRGHKKPTFAVYRLHNPDRVVVELSGATLGKTLQNNPVHQLNTWGVSQVELRDVPGRRPAVRLIANLARNSTYKIDSEKHWVVLRITTSEARPEDDIAREKIMVQQAKLKAELDKARSQLAESRQALINSKIAQNEAARAKKNAKENDSKAREAKARLQKANRALASAKKRHRDATGALENLESRYQSVREQMARAEERARKAQALADSLGRERDVLKSKEKSLREEKNQLTEKNSHLRSKERSLTKEKRRLAQENNALQKKFEELSKRASTLEVRNRRLERQLGSVREEQRAAETAAKRASETVSQLKAKRRAAANSKDNARLRQLEKQLKLAQAEKYRQEALLSDASTKIKELERARDKAKERAKVVMARADVKKSNAHQDSSSKKMSTTVYVTDVAYKESRATGNVIVDLTGPASAKVVSVNDKRAVMEIPSVELPKAFRRTLDVRAYKGPLKAVSSYLDPKNPSIVKIVAEFRYPTKTSINRLGNQYSWEFAKKSVTSRQSEVGGYNSSSIAITEQSISDFASLAKKKTYSGRKYDLDYRDADLHNLLRQLAKVGGINIVVPETVNSRVTVRLRNIPWDHAFDVILASKGLWYEKTGRIYRIDTREKLDAEAKLREERRKLEKESEEPKIEVFVLNYADATQMKAQLASLKSSKGKIEVNQRRNALIISDVDKNRREIIELVRRLDTPTPLVQVEARIVEARSTFLQDVGVQWGGTARASAQTGNATGLTFPSRVGVGGGATEQDTPIGGIIGDTSATSPDFAVNLPAAAGLGSGGALGLALGSIGGNFNLNLRLSALEDQGTVRIISSPKIKVVNNIEAEISQGVQIPISQVTANGVQTQFVNADLSLKVTPHVSERDCSVTMKLTVTKNEADFANTGARGDPTVLTKTAKTTVLVADGETTVLGGIHTRNSGIAYSKVPFLADIPVLGWLFKKRRESDERTELLIFVTPKITNRDAIRCES